MKISELVHFFKEAWVDVSDSLPLGPRSSAMALFGASDPKVVFRRTDNDAAAFAVPYQNEHSRSLHSNVLNEPTADWIVAPHVSTDEVSCFRRRMYPASSILPASTDSRSVRSTREMEIWYETLLMFSINLHRNTRRSKIFRKEGRKEDSQFVETAA